MENRSPPPFPPHNGTTPVQLRRGGLTGTPAGGTAEYADAGQCETALDDAIKAARRVIEANGMKEVTA